MGLEIQYGGQNVISFVLSCHRSKICQKDSPHQNVFKLTLSQKSFYVFRKDRQCKFIFLLSPSLDLINIISVRVFEAMKVAGETLRRSRRPSPAAGSYLQPCWYSVYELPWLENTKYPQLCLNFRGAQGRSPIKQVYLSAVVMEESGLTV